MGPPHRADDVTARAEILAAIRRAGVPPSPASPIARHPAGQPADAARFLAALEQVGARGVLRTAGASLHEVLSSLLGPGLTATVLRGRFAVAENGAVYVDAADLAARTDVVDAEHLVLVVPADAIVATMHEAVRRMPAGSGCGWFLSGPSKTADIEQSLVIGAQGARTLHVILET